MPTAVPTKAATAEPTASGTNIFKKPFTRTWRSIPKMLPTMMHAINRYKKFVYFVNSTTDFSIWGGSSL